MKNFVMPAVLLSVIFGCSSAGMLQEAAPAKESVSIGEAPDAEERIVPIVTPRYLDIWLDTAESELGSYHLILHYDEKIVSVYEVLAAPLTTPGSTTSPLSMPETFKSGKTSIVGIIPGRQGPKGRIHIAHVLFTPVESGKSPVSVSIKSLYDPRSRQITGIVELSATELRVEK